MRQGELGFQRRSSSSHSRTGTSRILPADYKRSSSSAEISTSTANRSYARSPKTASPLVASKHNATVVTVSGGRGVKVVTLIRSLFSFITPPNFILPTCRWLTIPNNKFSITPSLGRKVTGTLFGNRKGHVCFAIQDDQRAEPVLLLELPTTTSSLVKEMSSGLVRIALECNRYSISGSPRGQHVRLFQEPVWTMYCNGQKCGYAQTRMCNESDWFVLSTVQSVSVGAGVIPVVEDGRKNTEGELLYMRAKFERVVGSRDSEAFYMLNPDGNGGPELSIFMLRL